MNDNGSPPLPISIQDLLSQDFLIQYLIHIIAGIVGGYGAFKVVTSYEIYEQANNLFIYTSIFIILFLIFMRSAYGLFNATNRTRFYIISFSAVIIALIVITALWGLQLTQICKNFCSINENFDRFFDVYIWYYLFPNILIVSIISSVPKIIVRLKSFIGRIR